jgi:putative glutamine amidotransferase
VYGARRVVNSWHHQAVDRPGSGIEVAGHTPDGVIECIAVAGRPIVGVQWHPEWSVDPDPVFDWLIDRSAAAAARRSRALSEGVAS